MASGAMCREKRSDTWPHQPVLQRRPKNPCQRRAVHTWVESKRDAQIGRLCSAPAADGKRHDLRSNRSRAGTSDCRGRLFCRFLCRVLCRFFLTKSEIGAGLLLTESLLVRRLPGPGEEKPRLFENLPDHNPRREPERRARISLFESAVTH
jgi:hypothetical protein